LLKLSHVSGGDNNDDKSGGHKRDGSVHKRDGSVHKRDGSVHKSDDKGR
jgi:hypothetical protein